MNFLYYLIPKEKVAYIYENSTLRQAMEKMEFHRYTAVPIIDKEGKYVGILREGDILWYVKNLNTFDLELAEKTLVRDVPRKKDHGCATIDTSFQELVNLAIEQNFIPVVDDRDSFIGIVTRKTIILHLAEKNGEKKLWNSVNLNTLDLILKNIVKK